MVSSLAEQAGLSLSMASMSLRALESRGLLSARRVGRNVQYRLPTVSTGVLGQELAKHLKNLPNEEVKPLAAIFRAATGFTHPARVEIYRRLAVAPMNEARLAAMLRLSLIAVMRHLRKLESRGYIARHNGYFEVIPQSAAPGRILAGYVLAAGENITLQKV
jgi:DNA-binding transcriptional ArsR family regulator